MEHHRLVLRFQVGSQKYYCTEDHVLVAEHAVQLTGFSNTDFFFLCRNLFELNPLAPEFSFKF
jgi:hypothetical protein